jgi:hypothetical protein
MWAGSSLTFSDLLVTMLRSVFFYILIYIHIILSIVRLPKSAIIHKDNFLDPVLRSLLVGDLDGSFRIWKYDSFKISAYKKFANFQLLQHHPLQTPRNFSQKTLAFCKKEKKGQVAVVCV